MFDGLPTKPCWTAEAANAMFRVEALEGNEAIFLATHSPIRGYSLGAGRSDEIKTPDEHGVLDALSASNVHHAFCVVEGEPGSGKSHLIRWLYVNWPKDGADTVLLLQRSDGSLEGALAQLREKLPIEFRELFDGLGTKQKIAEAGRARTFHGNLLQALRPDHYEKPPIDNDWCVRFQPAHLLRPDVVEEEWDAPRRILRLISGKEGERNSESARFNVYDVYELQEILSPVFREIKSPAAQKLRAALVGESVEIEEARDAGLDADRLVRERGASIPHHIAFANALNRRKNDAIQHVVGVTSDSLKKLFREVRRALKTKSARLVLLLEDITSWEGLDDSLIDVLTTNAATRGEEDERDQCDLVSVVGLTPEYYDTTLRANYQDRITHRISLGDGEHGIQDVAMMRDPVDRQRFVSRYLAATRAGPHVLNAWREERRSVPDRAPPNPCLDCGLAQTCHAVFGAIDGIGFFPFTPAALDGFFEALDDRDQRRTWKTPRGVIQSILSPSLRQPEQLDAGVYPGANIEVAAFKPETRHASGLLDRLLRQHSDDEAERERLRRVMTFWGASGSERTTIDPDGRIAFHGVSRDVFTAFRLPWLGGEPGDAVTAPAVPAPPVPEQAATVVREIELRDTGVAAPARPTPAPARPASPPAAAPKPKLRLDPNNIAQWRRDNGELLNPNEWNAALYRIAGQIDPRALGYDGWLWDRLIQASTLKIAGTARAARNLLVLPAEPWLMEGLEAYAESEADPGADRDKVEYRQGRLARLLRHLKRHISAYIDETLGQTAQGAKWRPAVAAAQILLVRAWLRRVVLPTAPLAEQWIALLSDEGVTESARTARTAKWQTLLSATDKQHAELRTLLRDSLSLPQGASKEFGLASGVAAAAVVRLVETLQFSDVPVRNIVHTEGRKIIEIASEQLVRARDTLPAMMSEEQRRLADRSTRLYALLRGRSLRDHGARVDVALSAASEALPGLAPAPIRVWKDAYENVRMQLVVDERPLQATLQDFGAAEELPDPFGTVPDEEEDGDDPAAMLAALVTAQAAQLDSVLSAFTAGESAVALMADHAAATVARSGPIAGLETIHAHGAALVAGADAIDALLHDAGAA